MSLLLLPVLGFLLVAVAIILGLGVKSSWAFSCPEWTVYTDVHHRTAQVVLGGMCKLLIDSTVIFSILLIVLSKYHTLRKVAGKLCHSPQVVSELKTLGEKNNVAAEDINDWCKRKWEDSHGKKVDGYRLLPQKKTPKTSKPVPNYSALAMLFTAEKTVQLHTPVHLHWSI